MTKILIADDDDEIANLIRRIVARAGFQSLRAENGQEALDLITKEQPNLLLLDISMPYKNGLEILREVRGQSKNASMPVIMVTGKTDESVIVEALEAGADDYIPKPFDDDELIHKIESLLAQAEASNFPSQASKKKR